jgi:uroporphyrinogen decarboxylase
MNGKKVYIDAMTGKKPSRIPVTILSGGAWTFNNHGYTLDRILGRPELAAEIIVTCNRKVGSDAVWVGSGYNNLPVKALGGKLKFRPSGTPDVLEPLLKNALDADAIDPQLIAGDGDVTDLWQTARLVDREIGETTLVGGTGWGPFTLAAQLYGTERLMANIYKDKAAVMAVLDFAEAVTLRYLQGFIDNGVRIISIGEPTASGDMISRRHFEEFALPVISRTIRALRKQGIFTQLHICGNITNRLDLIPSSGVDVLSVDYKVDLSLVRETVGANIAFAGNVDPVSVLHLGTPGEVEAASLRCIEEGGWDGNFILMPGCDLPPGVPQANLKAFIETGKKHVWKSPPNAVA